MDQGAAPPRQDRWRGRSYYVIGQRLRRRHGSPLVAPPCAMAIGAAKSVSFENKKTNGVRFRISLQKVLKLKKNHYRRTENFVLTADFRRTETVWLAHPLLFLQCTRSVTKSRVI